MEQVTFQEYLDHRLSGEFEIEGPYEQLEYVLTSSEQPFYDARKASITFKASIDFFQMIYRYRKSLETEGMIFKGIKFKGIPIVTGEQIRERFYGEDQHLRLHNRLEKLKEWIQSKLDITEKEERGRPGLKKKSNC